MELHSSYERVFPVKSIARKIGFFTIYVIFAIAAALLSLFTMSFYVTVLGVFAEIVLILLTKKFLSVELEYSFIDSFLTVSRIYGKCYRRTVIELDIKSCSAIDFATPDALARAASMCDSDLLDLSCKKSDEENCVAVWDENKVRKGIVFTADERTLKILYRANAMSCSQEIRVKAR